VKLDASIFHSTQAVSTLKKYLGPNHVKVASALNNLGMVYHKKGDYKKSIRHYQESFMILVKNFS